MSATLTSKAARALPWLVLLLTLLAGSLPAGATRPSWQEATAVNRQGLEAAARKYLSPPEVELLQQAMSKARPGYHPRSPSNFEPPLENLKNGGFINDLVNIIKPCLARGDSAKVKQFFQTINQQKLIRGYGRYFLPRGGYGGPMVIQLELRQSPPKEFQVEVWYRLVNPGTANGKKQEGPRFTYGTGITKP